MVYKMNFGFGDPLAFDEASRPAAEKCRERLINEMDTITYRFDEKKIVDHNGVIFNENTGDLMFKTSDLQTAQRAKERAIQIIQEHGFATDDILISPIE